MSLSEPLDEPAGWPADATHDLLVGDWQIYQRRRGHRTSTDDVLTAWLAATWGANPTPRRYLDLGCGIGSVLLLTAHALRPAYSVGLEAQQQSWEMARRSIAELPDPPELRVVRGDLRDAAVLADEAPFDLITGSPPYLPPGTGVMSPDAQRRACRFELRGGVEAYCEAAARSLAPSGRFALVFQSAWHDRVVAAGQSAGLHLRARADVSMREDATAPFLTVYGWQREEGPVHRHAFAIRDASGEISGEYEGARRSLRLA